jgi:preprotein translocase subunit SecA
MSIVNKLVGKLFGDKAAKDRKALTPIADKTNEEFAKLNGLTNDQLRGKTIEFKKRIADFIKDEEEAIKKHKANIHDHPEMDAL